MKNTKKLLLPLESPERSGSTAKVVIEERIYVLFAEASLAEYLRIYETEGLVVQKPILGGMIGYFTTEFGTQNQLVHLWAYVDLEDRRRRRAELAKNAQWQSCLAKIRPMIQSMENRIMYPTSFSPLRALPVERAQPDTAFA